MSVFLKVQRFLFHSLSTLFIIFILSGCNFSVSGKIVPIKTKHSYQEEFKFTPDSHVIIKLYLEKNSEENETITTYKIENIKEFPIHFSVPLSGASRSSDLRISATVISGTGDEAKIGDFKTETVTPVPSWGSVTVEVVGLESCNAPHAGGFCTSKE